jgi:hypothetical protein
MAMNDFFWAQMERDPVGSLMEAPDPAKAMVGLFVKHIVATQSGGSHEDAARKIVSDVVKRTSGLDDLQQETEVAKAQRAVRGERPIHGRGDGGTVEEGLA